MVYIRERRALAIRRLPVHLPAIENFLRAGFKVGDCVVRENEARQQSVADYRRGRKTMQCNGNARNNTRKAEQLPPAECLSTCTSMERAHRQEGTYGLQIYTGHCE